MPEDIRAPFNIAPLFFRVEEPRERLPRGRQPFKGTSKKGKRKKSSEKLPTKGRFIDIRV